MDSLSLGPQERKHRIRKPLSEATKDKIRQANLGRVVSPETRAKLSRAQIGRAPGNKGIPATDEQKRKARENSPNRTGIPLSAEHRKKAVEILRIRNISRTGIPHTEEHKRKISEALTLNNHMRGKHHTEETRRILSEKKKGICVAPFDEAHRKHLSEAATGRAGTMTGKLFSSVHRGKIRSAKTGLPQTDEHRASIQAYWLAMTPDERAMKTQHLALSAPGLHSTSIEIAVWHALTARGIQYEVQKRFGRYIVDVWLPDYSLAIECDGCWWHACKECGYDTEKDRQTRSKNERRTNYIESKGCKVVHIWEHDIKSDVVNAVDKALALAKG